MDNYICPICKQTYKTKAWFDKHCASSQCTIPPKKKKKKRASIPGKLRKAVWETYVGQQTSARCRCCWANTITPFSSCCTFHAGHIVSDYNGGPTSLSNLLPICRDCNLNMGSEDWDSYIDRLGFPLRTQGLDPPLKVLWAAAVIQSLARMWLERKKPNSEWREAWRANQNTLI